MSMSRVILFGSFLLFAAIGVVGVVKKKSKSTTEIVQAPPPVPVTPVFVTPPQPVTPPPQLVVSEALAPSKPVANTEKDDFPSVDRSFQLFTTGQNKFPIVETVVYASSVPWLKGRPAWVADYASHYQTSRHFIARSLNGKPDYLTQKVSTGCRFNVFRADKNIQFYLLVDASRLKMGLYYVDLGTQERVLIKTFDVGLGRPDPKSKSGLATPLGTYSLGSHVAIYKQGVVGTFHDQKAEMIRIFGTRWIPFDKELEDATAPAKGLGLHGAPWKEDPKTGQLVENRGCIGAYDSDGCIRLKSEDIEEIFSIVITKPTYIVIVKDYHEAKLPGVERINP